MARMKAFTLHCYVHEVAQPSMSSLVPFAQGCPDLKTLALPSLWSGASDSLLPDALPAMAHGLRELTFEEVPAIARQATFIPSLHRLFPNLKTPGPSSLYLFRRPFPIDI